MEVSFAAYADSLRSIPLFSTLQAEELNQIIKTINVKRILKGGVILSWEDANNFMYIVLDGSVKVTQLTEDGKEILLASRETGEFFGEMSLIDGKTASATVSAQEDSVVGIISKSIFFSMLRSNEKVFGSLLQTLCSKIRASTETIQLLNHNRVSQRLRLLFKSLVNEYGQETESGILLKHRLTNQEIADRTGLSRQKVSTVINDWKREQLIITGDDKYIHISHELFNLS
ncbi:MAG: Crp/Fnr family transcriptional regulator [Nitrospirae bacterium]|nr:Crp/Fnr family transcriptional regulator [Nitrospirota bacterium]MBF0554573.1 Crp/Fnr family transcriptional regulator [Nitrospirota bacterium]